MELQKAISFLEQKQGLSVNIATATQITAHIEAPWNRNWRKQNPAGRDYYIVFGGSTCFGIYSGRDLIKLARGYQGGGWKKDMKRRSNSQNRARSRSKLEQEKFDDLPKDSLLTKVSEWDYT